MSCLCHLITPERAAAAGVDYVPGAVCVSCYRDAGYPGAVKVWPQTAAPQRLRAGRLRTTPEERVAALRRLEAAGALARRTA